MKSDQPPDRKQREDGLRTRKAILLEAVSLSTVEGLEGLSIGGLAKALGISKSGLYAHFGSKQELQLATIEEADRIFNLEVIEPAMRSTRGSPTVGRPVRLLLRPPSAPDVPRWLLLRGGDPRDGDASGSSEGADRRVPAVVHRPDHAVSLRRHRSWDSYPRARTSRCSSSN